MRIPRTVSLALLVLLAAICAPRALAQEAAGDEAPAARATEESAQDSAEDAGPTASERRDAQEAVSELARMQRAGAPRQVLGLKERNLERLEALDGQYESPRQALTTFYTAMEEYAVFAVDAAEKGRLLRLAKTALQWDGDPDELERVARELLFVLDRLEAAHLYAFPDRQRILAAVTNSFDPSSTHWAISEDSREVSWTTRRDDVEVRIDFVNEELFLDDARWLVSADTLRRVPGYARRLADVPVLDRVEARRDREAQARPWMEWMRYELRSRMPAVLLDRGFLLENWQWLGIALLVFLGLVLDKLVTFLLGRLIRRAMRSERISVPLPDEDMTNFERPFGLFVIGWFVAETLPLLSLQRPYESLLTTVAGVVALLAGIWALYRLIDLFAGVLHAKATESANRFDDLLVPLLRRTAKIVVTVLGIVWIASRISEDFYGVLAGLSIGSLAVGFAAKDSIENLFGTFTVLLDKPFALGDWITVGEVDGTVEDVGFRSTRVRTFANSVISVPNSTFIRAHVDNWGARRYRRIMATLALTYDTPPTKVEAFCEAVRQLVRDHPYTRKDAYHVYLNGFGASSLDVLLYCFVETPDWSTELREKHRLFNDVLRVAQELGVSFAFPTQSIHVVKPEDLEHPDAPSDAAEGETRGRETGRRVAAAGLERYGDEKPPPVVID